MLSVDRNSGGFTIIELMITIAVLGILVALVGPGMGEMIKNNRLAAQTNDLMSTLAYARAEAMRRGARITVCPSENGADCTGGTNWSKGLIVFVDSNRDSIVSSGEEIVRTSDAPAGNNTITATGVLASLQFRGSGVANPMGSFKICDDRPDKGRAISVASSGSLSLTKDVTCP